ncbi:hypothetical protein [Comamonas testosteroni]|uniref:hypothetical protein n=1 Tax=Comamonas testosteroni TaxID=285 RepID=UPI0005B4A2F7|nr:hypothetical protein [Comamonas testosteroni]
MQTIHHSFQGPAVDRAGERVRDLYQTLTHWVESSKLESTMDVQRRDQILFAPSAKMAIRRSKEVKSLWRSDWGMVKAQFIELGICYYYMDNPLQLGLDEAKDDILRQLVLSGLSEGMAAAHHRNAMASISAPRIAFLGQRDARPEAISRRVRAVNKKYNDKWTLVQWQGRHSSMDIHDLAVMERRPITYCGQPGMRLAGPGLASLAQCADVVVVFDDKQEKRHEGLQQAIKKAGLMVEIATVGKAKSGDKDDSSDNTAASTEEDSQTTLF